MPEPKVLIPGSMALDTIEAPTGSVSEVLGGAATYATVACSFFATAVPLCVVGEDFPAEHLELLRQFNVDLSGIQVAPGRTFRWRARYLDDLNQRETLETQLNVFADFRPQLTPEQRRARYLFLANIHPRLQLEVLAQVGAPALVAADTNDLWIATERPALEQVMAAADIMFLNDTEARLFLGGADLREAAEGILALGPRFVVIKRGEYGSWVFGEGEAFIAPAYPVERVVDPTGAGDAFAGAAVGYLAKAASVEWEALRAAIVWGAVAASFVVEDFSVGGLLPLTRLRLLERYRALLALTRFPPPE